MEGSLKPKAVWTLTVTPGIVAAFISAAYPGTDVPARKSSPPGFSPDGLIIDTIIIDNRNLYDGTGEKGFSDLIFRTANKLHYVTRARVINRELLFAAGEPFSTEIAEETARNLRTRLALNDAWIETEPASPGRVRVRVITRDQWSLLLGARVHRDGNETDYRFGVEERNLLGNHLFLSFDYFVPEAENNYLRWRLADSRFMGKPFHISLWYDDHPANEIRSLQVAQPYYDLGQRFSFSIGVVDRGGRQDLYRDSVRVAYWESRADVMSFEVNYRSGSYLRKIGIGLEYDYCFETTSGETVTDSGHADSVVFPSDSAYHEFRLGVSLADQSFLVTNRINGFSYPEDITLDRSVEVSCGRAFTRDLDDHIYDRLTASARYMQRFGALIVSLAYRRSLWFRAASNVRSTADLSLVAYDNALPFLTLAVRGLYLSDWRVDRSAGLALGGKNGLRGFNTRFLTGDRLLLCNLEGRFFPGIEILSVLFGGAVFTDVGRSWKPEEPLTLRGFEHSVGAGLRISMERFVKTELVRIDLAYSQGNEWHLSFGSGQYF